MIPIGKLEWDTKIVVWPLVLVLMLLVLMEGILLFATYRAGRGDGIAWMLTTANASLEEPYKAINPEPYNIKDFVSDKKKDDKKKDKKKKKGRK